MSLDRRINRLEEKASRDDGLLPMEAIVRELERQRGDVEAVKNTLLGGGRYTPEQLSNHYRKGGIGR